METIELSAAMAAVLKDNANPASLIGLNGSDLTKSTMAQISSVVGGLGEKVNVLSQLEIRGESYHLFDINYSVLWANYDFEISISNDRDLANFIYALVSIQIKDGQILTLVNNVIGSLRGFYYLLKDNSKRLELYLKIEDKDLHNVEVRFFGPEKRPDAGSSTIKVNQAITVFPNGAIEIK